MLHVCFFAFFDKREFYTNMPAQSKKTSIKQKTAGAPQMFGPGSGSGLPQVIKTSHIFVTKPQQEEVENEKRVCRRQRSVTQEKFSPRSIMVSFVEQKLNNVEFFFCKFL